MILAALLYYITLFWKVLNLLHKLATTRFHVNVIVYPTFHVSQDILWPFFGKTLQPTFCNHRLSTKKFSTIVTSQHFDPCPNFVWSFLWWLQGFSARSLGTTTKTSSAPPQVRNFFFLDSATKKSILKVHDQEFYN